MCLRLVGLINISSIVILWAGFLLVFGFFFLAPLFWGLFGSFGFFVKVMVLWRGYEFSFCVSGFGSSEFGSLAVSVLVWFLFLWGSCVLSPLRLGLDSGFCGFLPSYFICSCGSLGSACFCSCSAFLLLLLCLCGFV